MTRATDSTPSDAATERRPAGESVVAQFVCPFCGLVSDNPHGPCRQCGMENSQATRAATRGKIGPWFVLQVRNPSAPGMNWSTLMSLIERGRITPRSIVRGPTTGQLWRFAARVKGVSREFNSCWHCGDGIQRDARVCPSCKRLQQPPTNPDAMLETDLYAPPLAPRSPESEITPPPPPSSITAEPPAQVPVAVNVPSEKPPIVPIIDVDDTLPSGMEMRAFSLPDDYAVGAKPRSHVGRKLAFAAAVAILCGIAAGGYSPAFRDSVIRGYRTVVAKFTGRAQPSPQPPSVAPVLPNEPVTASHKQSAHTPLMNIHTESTDVKTTPSKIAEPRKQPKNQTKTRPANAPPTQPANGADAKIVSPTADPHAAEQRAWQLRDQAIKYEQNGDYAQALHDYELIRDLRLPDGVGPSDVQERLDRVKAMTKTDNH